MWISVALNLLLFVFDLFVLYQRISFSSLLSLLVEGKGPRCYNSLKSVNLVQVCYFLLFELRTDFSVTETISSSEYEKKISFPSNLQCLRGGEISF